MVNKGINTQIDELNFQNEILYSKLELLQKHILSFIKSDDSNFVGINRLDKEGFFITLTKKIDLTQSKMNY